MAGALLIDFGGTIAREVPARHRIYAEAARRAGLRVSDDQMAGLMAETHDALPIDVDGGFRYTRSWFEAFIERIFRERLGAPASALPGLREELFCRFADPATFEVFPDARRLLVAARTRGVPVAIVSNWSEALDELVGALDLGPVDALLSSAVEGAEKPDAAIFQAACARLRVAPADALHVGDSRTNDAHGATRAGLRAALLLRGPRPDPGPVGAPFPTIASLDEAIPLLP